MTRIPARRLLTVGGALCLAAGSVVAVGSGTAAAAPAKPTYEITLPAGSPNWINHWDISHNTGKCYFHKKSGFPVPNDVRSELVASVYTWPIDPHELQSGANTLWVECDDGGKSDVVTVYAPRNQLNDFRTQFSIDTKNLFGS